MGKKKDRPLLTYVYDTREQRPFDLAKPSESLFEDGGFYEDTLRVGDITCELNCTRLPVVIERKSLNDFIGCVGRDRDRFERELSILAAIDFVHCIIEAPFALIRSGSPRSQVSGLAIYNSIACWSIRFPNIHFWPCTSRTEAQVWAWTIINEAAKHSVGV